MLLELEADDIRVEVDPAAGGRIASLEVGGLQLLVPRRADPLGWGCYPMVPWAGRLRDGSFRFAGRLHRLPLSLAPHAIHGTTWGRAWRDEGGGRLAIDLGDGDGWPFRGRAVQDLALDPGGLRLRLELHAEDEPFPACIGWHPWFRRKLARGGEASLALCARWMYRRDAGGIATAERVPPGPGPWDDCFTGLEAPPRVSWTGALRVTLESSASHWVVYDEPADAFCVEPQTGPPDALNIAPHVVHPGRPLVAEARLGWVRA